jgi:hypothetical protein
MLSNIFHSSYAVPGTVIVSADYSVYGIKKTKGAKGECKQSNTLSTFRDTWSHSWYFHDQWFCNGSVTYIFCRGYKVTYNYCLSIYVYLYV